MPIAATPHAARPVVTRVQPDTGTVEGQVAQPDHQGAAAPDCGSGHLSDGSRTASFLDVPIGGPLVAVRAWFDAKAAADTLDDVRIKDAELKVTPLKAVTPEAAEDLANRLYGLVPGVCVTSHHG